MYFFSQEYVQGLCVEVRGQVAEVHLKEIFVGQIKILDTLQSQTYVMFLAKHTQGLLYHGTKSGRVKDIWTKDRIKELSFILPSLTKHPETVWVFFFFLLLFCFSLKVLSK